MNDDQTKDHNLVWLYMLKKDAHLKNQTNINLKETDFENKTQKSLYRQWDRIHIINNALYRSYQTKTKNNNTLILQFIVPEQMKSAILVASHDSTLSGHLGVDKTLQRISERYYWPKWETEVREYIASCSICQTTKRAYDKNGAQIKHIISDYPFQIITSDIAGPLPLTKKGNKYILVIIDHFTKWAQIHAIPSAIAEIVANKILKTILTFGIPDQILTDRGTNFQANTLKQVYLLLDIYQTKTTSYHPQCDGNSEVFIRIMKQMIRAFVDQNQKDWDEKLNHLIYAYNTAVHKTTKFSPFQLMFGRTPKIPIDFIDPEVKIDLPLNPQDYSEKLNITLKQAYSSVRTNNKIRIEKAQLNTKRVLAGCNFNIGDKVWYLNEKKKKNINKSLQNKFIGPYTIISILDNHINYIIKADNKKSKSITVHRSKLKKCISRVIESKIKQKSISIVDNSLNNDKTSTKLTKDRTLKNVKPDINKNGELLKKRGRPKKTSNTTSSNTVQSNSEIIITPLHKLTTANENTIIESVSIVNTVQPPQNNIVLKQYPLRNKLNKQM